jgi:hypothetical protein
VALSPHRQQSPVGDDQRHDDEAMRSRILWLMVLTVWQMLLQRDFEETRP